MLCIFREMAVTFSREQSTWCMKQVSNTMAENKSTEMVLEETNSQEDIQQLNFQGHVTMGNVRMTDMDFQSLHARGELEDNVILFFMEYHLEAIVPQENREQVAILGPSLTNLLMNLPSTTDEEEVLENIKTLNLMHKKLVLAVIYNQLSSDGHWSLLAFTPSNLTFYHMDSYKKLNRPVAGSFAKRLKQALKLPGNGSYFELSIRQQRNLYDCGLYVIESSKKILEHLFVSNQTMEDPFESEISVKSSEKRQELMKIAQSLADSRQM